MPDINIRNSGRAGLITLNRPKAMNALTYDMCMAIDAALVAWRGDPAVRHVVIDAEGDKAFCAGGDIADLYATGTAGNYDFGRTFWRDEYRLNAMMAAYPKPIISFMQGFTMGGGVGIGCHGSHRIVGETSRIAMPECGIGLLPDVGGSYILARAPGRLGEYLGTTAARMDAADAIHVGFADHFIPQADWDAVKSGLIETENPDEYLSQWYADPNPSQMKQQQDQIDTLFSGQKLQAVIEALRADDSPFAQDSLKSLNRTSPLSSACTIEALHRLRHADLTIQTALQMEYRFTWRAMEHGDFLEGIRAAIIDKDRSPSWQFAGGPVPDAAVTDMLAPLGTNELTFDQQKETP